MKITKSADIFLKREIVRCDFIANGVERNVQAVFDYPATDKQIESVKKSVELLKSI